ncbi:MAG TPA: hypothetical protein VFU43_18495 [Streptosporangiaceae bacterium]|nr:hypothetical protein [Streptosporangiaceae bacterium]
MSWRQQRLGRVAAAACVGAATMTITMAVPAAAASGSADCPGIDLSDPLGSVKCPVDEVTQRVLPSKPATSVPTTPPAPVRTSAPAAKPSASEQSTSTRPARRSAPAAAEPAAEKSRDGGANVGPATMFMPSSMPASVQLPNAEPSYPYPEVLGVPGRSSVRAAAAEGAEDARAMWARIAAALVMALVAGHLGVVTRRLRQETDRPGT